VEESNLLQSELKKSQIATIVVVLLGVVVSMAGFLLAPKPMLARIGFGGTLVLSLVPLGLARQLVGLFLQSQERARQSAQEVQNLRARVAAAEQGRRFSTSELERVRLLAELSQMMVATEDFQEMLNTVLARSMEALVSRSGFIMLLDPGRQELVVEAAAAAEGSPISAGTLRLGEGVPGWVAQQGKPLTIGANSQGAGRHGLQRGQTLLSVPMKRGQELVGVITVEEKQGGDYLPQDVEFLQVIASQVASALEKTRMRAQIEEMSLTDQLTQLANRRRLDLRLKDELARAQRYQTPLAVTMFDIDHFKRFNDTYGHLVGDEILRHLARTVSGVVREADLLARYGGEEFTLLSPDCDARQGWLLAERVREAVQAQAIQVESVPHPLRITVSLGVAAYPQDAQEGETLVKCADMALYHAKRSGRNRTCVYEDIKERQLPPEQA